MPRWIVYALLIVTALALVPLALVARARMSTSTRPRLHVVPDMDSQPKFKPQSANPMFADGRAMRPPVPGTVPRAASWAEAPGGRDGAGQWLTALPLPVTELLLRRGQERYDVFCSPCHGLAGYGDGTVAKRADRLREAGWTPPSSLHGEVVRERPVGHLYNTISNGIRTMPAYGSQIPPQDRWAIVAYVGALQRSQNARPEDVPGELRAQLR